MTGLPPLTVIEASAGTGKTFALVTRLLKLIFNGTHPERIVALTFSRKAAGEIFNSFIERISRAAQDERMAAEEGGRIGLRLSAGDFTAKLREVIACQHLSLIGTLDSFMMRAVRMAPLELGLEGEVKIMSGYRSPVERLRLTGEMLMRESEDAKTIFRQAFRLACGRAGTIGFLKSFSEFIEDWHGRFCDACVSGRQVAWGDASAIWGEATPRYLDVTLAEIRNTADRLSGYAGERGADTFLDNVRDFRGGKPPVVPVCMKKDPAAAEAVAKMAGWNIARALETTQGIYLLMTAYESVYASKIRAKGLLTFEDMPRLLCTLDEAVRLSLEYRMDARFEHWMLDEFQDTSRSQWKALENLIRESSAPDAGRSVFIVGDRKQAIYDWRGGDVTILGEQVERARQPGNLLDSLDESRRYVSVIAEAVSRVFDENGVCGALDMDDAPRSARWECRPHRSHDRDTPGFVEVIQAVKAEGRRSADLASFLVPIENALNAVRPWERGISTAVLVRENATGRAVLEYLKSQGISNVVFEGECDIMDSPVLSCMTELVRMAEHADDGFAYAHIRCSPIAAAMFPDGMPEPAELSARLLEDFSKFGMVRKFREVREALKAVPDTWNEFTESRFEDFIKCASEFEMLRDSSMRLSDFIGFLSHKTHRDFAESGKIRVLTMHQSKGLGFDWVIIPFIETNGLSSGRHTGPLVHSDPDWILQHPGADVEVHDPVLAAAERARRQMQVYSSLCVDYVAMTRAKRALTVILHPENKNNRGKQAGPGKFSDLVRMSGLKTCGDPAWYQKVRTANGHERGHVRPEIKRSARKTVGRLIPSESGFAGIGGDALFDSRFGGMERRGKEIHLRYQAIEWADGGELANLPDAFRVAFERKDPSDAVWRERSYELLIDGKWESGQFDRVVFTGNAGVRSAVIYDFKTNACRQGESRERFAERMRIMYAGQMASYRRALSNLTGIGSSRIGTVLLLEATGAAVGL